MEGSNVMLTARAPYLDRLATSGRRRDLASFKAARRASGEGCVKAVMVPKAPALDTAHASWGTPTHLYEASQEGS